MHPRTGVIRSRYPSKQTFRPNTSKHDSRQQEEQATNQQTDGMYV